MDGKGRHLESEQLGSEASFAPHTPVLDLHPGARRPVLGAPHTGLEHELGAPPCVLAGRQASSQTPNVSETWTSVPDGPTANSPLVWSGSL